MSAGAVGGAAESPPQAAVEFPLVAIKKQKVMIGEKKKEEEEGVHFSLLREIKLLKELSHPNIVKLYDVFHLKGRLYYALEFAPTNLYNLTIQAKNEIILEQKHIKCIIKQVIEGISHLHSNWIMHRDLKSENIIINEHGVIKLIDFNSAKVYGSPDR